MKPCFEEKFILVDETDNEIDVGGKGKVHLADSYIERSLFSCLTFGDTCCSRGAPGLSTIPEVCGPTAAAAILDLEKPQGRSAQKIGRRNGLRLFA
jgi:hypothetical protein